MQEERRELQDVNSKLSLEYDEVLTELGEAKENVFFLQQRLQVLYIQQSACIYV